MPRSRLRLPILLLGLTLSATALGAASSLATGTRAAEAPGATAASSPSVTVPPTTQPRVPPPQVTAEPTDQAAPSAAPDSTPRPRSTVVRHGSREGKVIALTFDDGWDGANVRAILGVLREERVPATFFPVGAAVTRNPDVWRAVADAGYPIANHTQNHPDMAEVGSRRAVREIESAASSIEDVIGRPILPVFRPPGGGYDDGALDAAAAAGMHAVVLWDVDTGDWRGTKASAVVRRALAGRSGSIVLLHCGDNAADAVRKVVQGYRKRGYRFVTIGQLLGIPGDVPTFPPDGRL